MIPTAAHYIRPNEVTRIPRYHVIIDSEASIRHEGPNERQTWRMAVATFMHLTRHNRWVSFTEEFTNPADLWRAVTGFGKVKNRTVVWSHNLAYDLRVTDAMRQLDRLNYELVDIRLHATGTWGKWKGPAGSLTAVDSAAVFPCKLQTLAAALGMGKLPRPAEHDTEGWMRRCRRDVEILATAVRAYLQWLRDADMGNWQMTGAGQSFSAFRHKWMTHRILVSDDLGARDAERRAMWTGRCEAWTHGGDSRARVYDYDFLNAYPRICLDTDLPVRQVGTVRVVGAGQLKDLMRSYAVLAEVTVTTAVPVVPTEHGGFIVWPTGTFQTTLWDPELRLLMEAGAEITVRRAWLYRKAPALKQWAEWILGELSKDDRQVPAWRKIILKHWSRALIGRFAMRYQGWEDFGTSPEEDFAIHHGKDADTDDDFTVMQVGHRLYAPGQKSEADNAVPAITGYIMSEARRRLWNAVQVIGEENVLYLDTDSVLVGTVGHQKAVANMDHPDMAGLRLKRRFTGWAIAGPRQLIVGGEPRISGVPKTAVQTDPWVFKGYVWRTLGTSIRMGEPGEVLVKARTFHIRHVDHRRARDGTERTKPFELAGPPAVTDLGTGAVAHGL